MGHEKHEVMKRRRRKVVLSSEEVCNIIKTCASLGVCELKFADLYLKVGRDPVALSQAISEEAISEDELKIEEEKYLAERELESKEDRIKQMIIEDPVMYEQLIEQGEFESDGDAESPQEV